VGCGAPLLPNAAASQAGIGCTAFDSRALGRLADRRRVQKFLCGHTGGAQNALFLAVRDGRLHCRRCVGRLSRQMKKLLHFLHGSLTYDRGTEMTSYKELVRRLNIDLWIADPHAPWQPGSNENTNGLLRQFMPKDADLSNPSQEYLNNVAN